MPIIASWYMLFNCSSSAEFKLPIGLLISWDGASMSVTRLSDDATDCLTHTPRVIRSATNAGYHVPHSGLSRVFKQDFLLNTDPFCQKSAFLLEKACCRLSSCWEPSRLEHAFKRGSLYLILKAALN